ncbi:MAG: aldehyde dehydrogenase family protein [Acidobacteria bacterium]|nr:aldehyde dehydrogenase family protein [Acidobacteriota bacterium]
MLQDQDQAAVQEVRGKVEQAYAAWQSYRTFSQQQVDAVVEAVAAAGRKHARRLAELAVAETGMGNADDKYAKNMLCADLLPRAIAGVKTVGVLREDPSRKITEIGVPQGVVAAICPTTNPTSTVFYKAIIALKSGNAIVLSPHPRAKDCTCAAAAVVMEAAAAAGAPQGLVQCLENSSLEATQALMKHPRTGVILATGGAGMVRAAYSSGKPAFGVGPGNVPVLIDTSAPLATAVQRVIDGKRFDYGTVCSSEQVVVAERSLREPMLAAFRAGGAYVLNDAERQAVERTLFTGTTTVRAECVGQSPQRIAQLAGFQVPGETKILLAEIGGVGKDHPLSAEKLSPVLAVLFTECFDSAVKACESILQFGGLGHTSVIHAEDTARVKRFGEHVSAFRVLVNTSSPQGSVGITTNLQPSMTLGCGAMAGNITSDNVGPLHLINIKRVAWAVRTPQEAAGGPAAASGGAVIDKAALIAAVERYLAQKGIAVGGKTVEAAVAAALPAAPAAAPSCGCSANKAAGTAPAPTPAPVPAPAPSIPAPKIQIVDFVCEADVREALSRKKKIFIGPKTIVTPAARDAASQEEVLVMAERPGPAGK